MIDKVINLTEKNLFLLRNKIITLKKIEFEK